MELRFAPVPPVTARDLLPSQPSAMPDVDQEPERTLGDRLRHGAGEGKAEVRRRPAKAVLHDPSQPRVRVHERYCSRHLAREGGRSQDLPKDADSKTEHISPQGDQVPLERLGIRRMLRSCRWERRPTRAVCILDRLHHIDKIPHINPIAVISSYHATGDHVHLGPVHTRRFRQRLLEPVNESLGIRSFYATNLDMDPPVARPYATLTTTRMGDARDHRGCRS
jgi:hypothetical protein